LVIAAAALVLPLAALLTATLRLARLLTSLAAGLVAALIRLARLILRGLIAPVLCAIPLGRTALLTVTALRLLLVVLVLVSHLESPC
jgi:hypothetical protein